MLDSGPGFMTKKNGTVVYRCEAHKFESSSHEEILGHELDHWMGQKGYVPPSSDR